MSVDRLAVLEDAERNELESLLMDFDQGWEVSSLDQYTGVLASHPSARFRESATAELIKIDMQRSWATGEKRWLEEYLQRFPHLGTLETVDPDLIFAEYEARKNSDQDIDLDCYEARFPNQFDQLQRLGREWIDSTPTGSRLSRRTAAEPSQASIDTSRIAKAGDTEAGRGSEVSDELPHQFGRYRIIRELGAGAMGRVFLAHDSQLDRQVALKTPSFGGSSDGDLVTRFYREARAAGKIQHRNICPIYDVGEIDGRHFISMAFVKGRCMSDYIKPDKLPPQRTSAILVERLARALSEAHRHRVIHRDLKPANIMIDLNKEPVVMDFGLARQTDVESRVTQSGMAVGTPAYMSPEQIHGDLEEVGAATDIYALGVILYELLTGRLPFRGSIAKVVYAIVHEDPSPPSRIREGIDPELDSICAKMMAKNRDERYQTMDDVAGALANYLKAKRGGMANKPTAAKVSESQSIGLTETGALNAFFAAKGSSTSMRTTVEPAPGQPSIPVVKTELRVKSDARVKAVRARRGGWPKLIAIGFGGLALLAGVTIYFADGSKVELADGANAKVEVHSNGTLKSITSKPPPNRPATRSVSDSESPANRESRAETHRVDQQPIADQDGRITIHSVSSIASMAVSPDGRSFATATAGDPGSIEIRSTDTGRVGHRIARPQQDGFFPRQLAYSPDGQSIVYSSSLKCIAADAGTGRVQSEQEFPAWPMLVLFPRSTLAMALFHHEQVHRTKRGEVPQQLRIWNWKTNRVLCDQTMPVLKGSPLGIPSVAPDESFITFGWGNNYYVRYDLIANEDHVALGKRSMFEQTSRVRGPLVFSPDGRYAAASLKNGQCIGVFFDIDKARVIHRLDPATARAHNQGTAYGCSFAFAPGGKRIVCADHMGRVALWEFPSGEFVRELAQFETAGDHTPPRVEVTSNNRVIIAGDYADSRIIIEDLGKAEG